MADVFGVQEQAKRFFGRVWEDLIGYLGLYDFLKVRASSVLSSRTVCISSIAEFWHGVLGERCAEQTPRFQVIRDGDTLRLQNMFMTEWTPKVPGQIWTPDGRRNLMQGQERVESQKFTFNDGMYTVLDPEGKRLVLNAGRGTIRAARGLPASTPEAYAYMGIVDTSHWNCDYGIPLVVSKPVADLVAQYTTKGAPEVLRLEGVVRIEGPKLFDRIIPRAIGATLSPESEETLRYRPALPQCYIHVISPLSIRLAHNDSHPLITAWTMYSTDNSKDAYGYTYTELDPTEKGAFEEAASFLQKYALEHGANRLVTDFDGVTSRLEAEIRIDKDPLHYSRPAVERLSQGVDRWTAETMQRLEAAGSSSQ
jgi:hypothetical protein